MQGCQFNLQSLFAIVTIAALVVCAAVLAGWTMVVWLAVAAACVTLLALAWAIAPRATSHLVLSAAFGAALLAMLVCGIQQSRAVARQERLRENMRRFAIGVQEQSQFAAPQSIPSSQTPHPSSPGEGLTTLILENVKR